VVCPGRGGSDPGGEGFDGVDDQLEAEGTEQVEGVLGAGKLGVDDRIGRDAGQRGREVPGDLHRRHGVVVAVGDEARRRVRSDMGQR
jgi:hypothetical protein